MIASLLVFVKAFPSGMMVILKALPVIWKFWGEFKTLFGVINKLKNEREVKAFLKQLDKASTEADIIVDETGTTSSGGDTSEYEDIILRGNRKLKFKGYYQK